MLTAKIFENVKTFILDTLFPIHCLICKKSQEWVCQECLRKISILNEQVCPYCEKNISPFGKICPNCKEKFLNKKNDTYLDALIVSTNYKKNNISRLIHHYKYNFVTDLKIPLAQIIIEAITKNNLPLPDIIIPVPLHMRRLRWRGFNQSELLAEEISRNLTPGFLIPILKNILLRRRFTIPQMKIKNYQERKNNLENAFIINSQLYSNETLENKSILLIDDVATTGSTINECAKILKENGAKKVFGAVIARQEL
jgi:ComF family protein